MKRVILTQIDLGNSTVPAKIYRELRSSVRASIGKKHAVLRLPYFFTKNQRHRHEKWFEDWVKRQFAKNAQLQSRFAQKLYGNGEILKVGDRAYTINIETSDRKTDAFKLADDAIVIKLSNIIETEVGWRVKKMISRAIAKDYHQEIEDRVYMLNGRHINRPVKNVRLKYNYSNWGSCSNTGNINLSTRVLFAPKEVIDYVIVHELVHLIEMNHSRRFWSIVQEIVPDFTHNERWLKENGHLCDF